MRKNDVNLLIALLALTISGCTSTSKKKAKKSSVVESSSVLSSSKQVTSNTSSPTSNVGHSSEAISSASNPEQSSETPVSSAYPSSSVPYVSSAQPTQSSQTPTPSSSSGWQSSVTPSASSSIPQTSSGTTKPSTSVSPVIGNTDYTYCQEEYDHGNASKLLDELRKVTKDGQSGSYDDLWGTYNSCYVRNDGSMYDYYSNITHYTPGSDQDKGSHPTENYSYNREHSIPKSRWGGDKVDQGADPFIVVPTDAKINEIRNNYPFGFVETVSEASKNNYSVLGSAVSSWGYSGTVFEPNDEVKGDFARIYFYAIAKYSDSYDWTTYEGDVCFTGSPSTNFGLTNYSVKLFSYWANLDPVSEWERSINNKIEPIHGCRNPFIDHPEYANVLWGSNSNYTPYNH